MHEVLSDTLGSLSFHVVHKAEDYETQVDLLNQILKVPYTLLLKNSNKTEQAAGALCLSKVVQAMPRELLIDLMEQIMDKIVAIFKTTALRAHAALLQSLIAIIFHVDEEMEAFVGDFVPVLLEQVASSDWNTQKVSIETINALATVVQDCIIPHRVEVLKALKPCRVHKMKPVRDAAQWTIKLLKESHPPLEPHELAILEDNPQKQGA